MNRIVGVVVAIIALASCSKKTDGADKAAPGSSAAADPGDLDPCSLVTAEEAGALIGGAPDKPQRVKNAMASVCVYPRAGGEVRIMKTTLPDIASFKPDKNALDAGAKPVPGIGDDAFVLDGKFDMIAFRKGLVQIAIFVAEPTGLPDTGHDALVAIGTKAASRM